MGSLMFSFFLSFFFYEFGWHSRLRLFRQLRVLFSGLVTLIRFGGLCEIWLSGMFVDSNCIVG